MTASNIAKTLKAKGYTEAACKNKNMRIFAVPDEEGEKLFVYSSGKVRKGKSIAKSVDVTEDVNAMLGQTGETKPDAPVKAEKVKTKTASPAKRTTKSDIIVNLLKRLDGATLQELTDASGWQQHSVRGFLSTLRKKTTDHEIVKYTRDNTTMYKLEPKETKDAA